MPKTECDQRTLAFYPLDDRARARSLIDLAARIEKRTNLYQSRRPYRMGTYFPSPTTTQPAR